jgi:hypothetical protein
MGLIAGQGLSSKPQALVQSVERRGPDVRSLGDRAENLIESGQDQGLEGGATLGGSDFGSMENFIGQINRCFHKQ